MSEILPIESANMRYSDDEHPKPTIAKYIWYNLCETIKI